MGAGVSRGVSKPDWSSGAARGAGGDAGASSGSTGFAATGAASAGVGAFASSSGIASALTEWRTDSASVVRSFFLLANEKVRPRRERAPWPP